MDKIDVARHQLLEGAFGLLAREQAQQFYVIVHQHLLHGHWIEKVTVHLGRFILKLKKLLLPSADPLFSSQTHEQTQSLFAYDSSMKKSSSDPKYSRRQFVALAGAALAFPTIIPSRAL